MVPVFIGCPPGKRLAFDVSYTIKHSIEMNKHYLDCVNKDPEMPCFLFRDCVFHPFSQTFCPPVLAICLPPLVPSCHSTTTLCSNLESPPLVFRSSLDKTNFFLPCSPSQSTVFQPFFLVQDLVTGDSGSFKGR